MRQMRVARLAQIRLAYPRKGDEDIEAGVLKGGPTLGYLFACGVLLDQWATTTGLHGP